MQPLGLTHSHWLLTTKTFILKAQESIHSALKFFDLPIVCHTSRVIRWFHRTNPYSWSQASLSITSYLRFLMLIKMRPAYEWPWTTKNVLGSLTTLSGNHSTLHLTEQVMLTLELTALVSLWKTTFSMASVRTFTNHRSKSCVQTACHFLSLGCLPK